jgi:acetyl-CoA carboxylase carboxyl transferase subunit alpha
MTTESTSAWSVVELARHPERPYALDYIRRLVPGFVELKGDRLTGDDAALVAGVGRWHERSTMWFGQQKGRNLHDRVLRHYGMMFPEGYRKASRLSRQAAKFHFPIISLIDTPGAYPGAASEERGIASAIGQVIMDWFEVRVPIVAVVIGEGGSGGALGMAIADRVLMFQNSIYSVAAPEAAASIIWRDGSHKTKAAEQLCLTAPHLLEMNVVEEVIPEPSGGAHTDVEAAAAALDEALWRHLQKLLEIDSEDLLRQRYERYRYLDSVFRRYLQSTETLL